MKHSTLPEGMSIEDIKALPDDELWMIYRDHLCYKKVLRFFADHCPHGAELVWHEQNKKYAYQFVVAEN